MTAFYQTVQGIAEQYRCDSSYLLDMLREIQLRELHISNAAIDILAKSLEIPRVRIEGVVGFYRFFTREPAGQYHLLFSANITDEMAGKAVLQQRLQQKLGVKLGQTRADGRVRVEDTSCTGMSDQGPALLVNGQAVPNLTLGLIDAIAANIEAQTPLKSWPSTWFEVQTHVRQTDFLLGNPFEPGSALRKMQQLGLDATWNEIERAGLHGCGGAGFKTGLKWKLCQQASGKQHFVVCNADEGEPGTFKDRVLLQAYSDLVVEGITVCARIIGAHQGFIYLRGEYAYLRPLLNAHLAQRRAAGLLGQNILGQGWHFDLEVRLGAGAYICGEESALIHSLEGMRGHPRIRPPFPVTHGYCQQPTVVNNVETFAQAAQILVQGADRFAALGTENSRGTKLLSISGDCAAPGIYEFPYGTSVRAILAACKADDPQAVQVAGAAGTTLPPSQFNRILAFEDVATGGSWMIFNQQRNLMDMVSNFARFFVHESCGFCTPCRVGTSLLQHLLSKICNGQGSQADLAEIRDLAKVMKSSSQCGLGATAPNHFLATLDQFPHLYASLLKTNAGPSFDLEQALSEARKVIAMPASLP